MNRGSVYFSNTWSIFRMILSAPTAPRPQPSVRCDSPGKDYTRNPQGARRSYSKKLAQFNH